jgi:hypothetical protein
MIRPHSVGGDNLEVTWNRLFNYFRLKLFYRLFSLPFDRGNRTCMSMRVSGSTPNHL